MEFLLFLFMAIGVLPVFCLYIFDRVSGDNHEQAIKKFNVTLAIISCSPLAGVILLFGLSIIGFALIFVLDLFWSGANIFFSKIINDYIFESPVGAALVAIIICVTSAVRMIIRDPEILFWFNPKTNKIETKED